MKPIEKLAVAQAVYKMAASLVSTKSPDSLRALCDADMRANYESTGAKSYDVTLDGQKVGTYSVKTSKASSKPTLEVVDMKAYVAYCVENGYITTDDAQVRMHLDESGEVPDGCEVRTVEKPGGYAGTVLKVDEEAVVAALGDALLPTVQQALLEGGE